MSRPSKYPEQFRNDAVELVLVIGVGQGDRKATKPAAAAFTQDMSGGGAYPRRGC